jgi:hypothetical protein
MQARLGNQQMKALEFPEEAAQGQRELEMQNRNSNLVQKQLFELTQQVVHIVQACNEEAEVVEDGFESVKANMEIFETTIQTDKYLADSDVVVVGGQLQLPEAVL